MSQKKFLMPFFLVMPVGSKADAGVCQSVGTGTPSDITWANLVKHEPRLKALLDDAQAISKNPKAKKHADAAWYGWGNWPGLKPRMVFLVGWGRGINKERGPMLEVVNLAELPLPPRVNLDSLSEGEQVLHSREAYDVAYKKLCKACGCM